MWPSNSPREPIVVRRRDRHQRPVTRRASGDRTGADRPIEVASRVRVDLLGTEATLLPAAPTTCPRTDCSMPACDPSSRRFYQPRLCSVAPDAGSRRDRGHLRVHFAQRGTRPFTVMFGRACWNAMLSEMHEVALVRGTSRCFSRLSRWVKSLDEEPPSSRVALPRSASSSSGWRRASSRRCGGTVREGVMFDSSSEKVDTHTSSLAPPPRSTCLVVTVSSMPAVEPARRSFGRVFDALSCRRTTWARSGHQLDGVEAEEFGGLRRRHPVAVEGSRPNVLRPGSLSETKYKFVRPLRGVSRKLVRDEQVGEGHLRGGLERSFAEQQQALSSSARGTSVSVGISASSSRP